MKNRKANAAVLPQLAKTSTGVLRLDEITGGGLPKGRPTLSWLPVRNLESNGERNRGLNSPKSRGMPHPDQVREFVLSNARIQLIDVYTGAGSVLTGSAPAAQLERGRAAEALVQQEMAAKRAEIQIESLKATLAATEQDSKRRDGFRMAERELVKGPANGE